MPINTINLAGIEPIGLPTGISSLFSDMLKTSNLKHENKIKGVQAEHAPKMAKLAEFLQENKANFAPQMNQADLELKQAQTNQANKHANWWEQGGSRGTGNANSPKERRILFNAMGPDAKAEMFRIGGILGFNPQQTQDNFIEGMDFASEAKERGIDLGQEAGNFLATSANRTQIKNAESAGAELDYLEKATAKDLSQYGVTFNGYSPKQIVDALSGKDEDAQIRFLGARALQPEIAGARSRVAGGSNASEALHDAQEAALGNFKIFGPLVTPRIREGVQKYINEKLKEGLKARKKSMAGINHEEKEEHDGSKYLKKADQLSTEELQQMLRNTK